MNKLLLLTFLILHVVSGCHRPDKSTENEAHRVQVVLDSLVQVNQVPGVNYAIVFEDQTIKSYSSGYADVHQRTLMTPDHVMFSGSVGKTYAVAMLMQLLDEGLFALEDRIIDYFPDLDWIKMLPNSQAKNLDPNMSYGMGSFIYITNHGLAYAHTGSVPGFNSIFAHYPDLQVSVALQVNCDYASQKIPLIDYLDALLE